MNRFIFILLVVLLVGFVVQQSQVVERVKVVDPVLRVPKEEYHVNMENLTNYLSEIPDKTEALYKSVATKIKKWTSKDKR